jgi:hypothetical protein
MSFTNNSKVCDAHNVKFRVTVDEEQQEAAAELVRPGQSVQLHLPQVEQTVLRELAVARAIRDASDLANGIALPKSEHDSVFARLADSSLPSPLPTSLDFRISSHSHIVEYRVDWETELILPGSKTSKVILR